MAAISSLQIGGVTYDIYAKSAEQAPGSSHELSSHSHFSTYFNGTSANTALTAKTANSAATATIVQMQAKSDNTWYQSLFASTSTSSIWYDSDAKVQYNPSSNTFSSTNLYGTTVSGATISGTNITAATTVRGTNISGTNISGASKTSTIDNLITNAGRTIGNGTITITTASAPSTSQTFTVNQTANSSIVFGTMAFKASGDYSLSSHNHYLSALNGTATYFSGTTAAPSALSALTSKSALSAGSATTAANASTAANANKGVWAAVTDNRNYPVAISLDSKFNYTTTGGANHIYFNPASGQLNVVSAVKIGGCQMKWNASTSALDFNF